ncbi:MAG: DUF3786 domain-containing protein [Planctomycetes bacterium]|jgi:hypothetical protein|nr:DUF3786 domain-containing protein [Planctomycetota bacterium]
MADLSGSHGPLWEALRAKGARRAALDAGAEESGGRVRVALAGRPYVVDPETRRILGEGAGGPSEAGFAESVVLLSYLAAADGSAPAGEWVSEKGLPLGDVFFRPPHGLPSGELAARFGADPDGLVRAAEALGGRRVAGADRAVEVPALPRVPLRILLWLGDEEFPGADVRFLFDRDATRYLRLDGILMLAAVTAGRLRAGA